MPPKRSSFTAKTKIGNFIVHLAEQKDGRLLIGLSGTGNYRDIRLLINEAMLWKLGNGKPLSAMVHPRAEKLAKLCGFRSTPVIRNGHRMYRQ